MRLAPLAALLCLFAASARAQNHTTDAEQTDDQRTTADGTSEAGSQIMGPSAADVPAVAQLHKPAVARPRDHAPATSPGYGVSGGGGGSIGGGGGGGGDQTGSSKGLPSISNWIVSDSINSMAEHMEAHGVMRFGPKSGYAVGFNSGPATFGNGHCVSVRTSRFHTSDSCSGHEWISKTPGGPPIKGCGPKYWDVSDNVYPLFWLNTPAPGSGINCILKPQQKYYCDLTMENGWKANKSQECVTILDYPLGDVPAQ